MDQTEAGETVISDRVKVNGTVTAVILTSDGKLRWLDRCLAVEKEVLGFAVEGSKIVIKAIVEPGAGICCGGSKGAFVRKRFTLEPLSEDSLQLWSQKLHDYIDSLGRPKRLYVFVNPFGGKRSASKIFIDVVKPMLEDANVQYTVQETKRRLHAKEVAQTMDLSKYDGIVCVSGDGILVEVVNGLLERKDWSTAIRMPLGVVPAGTGNGMAKSVLDSVGEPCTPSNAVLTIIRGLIADIDIESEKYRWMGSARIDFYAIERIFSLRKYNGCIRFVPAPGYEAYGEATSEGTDNFPISSDNGSGEGPVKSEQYGYRDSDLDFKNLSWRKIDGPFISVWLHNVPWGGEDTMAAPDAKFSDGYLDLILMKDCPKLGLLTLMTELNNGGHVKSPYVEYIKVKAFMLEPGPRSDDLSKEGIIDVDGEVLARGKRAYKCDEKALMTYDKLSINVDQGLATVFSPV